MAENVDGTGLDDVLHAIRADLTRIQQEGRLRSLKFEVQDVNVELKFTASQEAGAGIKFNFFNSSFKCRREVMHTINLKLCLHDDKAPFDQNSESGSGLKKAKINALDQS